MSSNGDISDRMRIRNIQKNEMNLKFVIIGDFGVGKTSIINRYVEGEFSDKYRITIGSDFGLKTIEWDDDTRISLQIWDVAGHERFNSLTGVFYRHSVGAAIVFDLTRPDTFKSVDKWLSDLRRKTQLPGGRNIPVILLANKGDITTCTIPSEISDYCQRNDILAWFITSAKDNLQIDEAMLRLINAALTQYQIEYTQPNEDTVRLGKTENNRSSFWNCYR